MLFISAYVFNNGIAGIGTHELRCMPYIYILQFSRLLNKSILLSSFSKSNLKTQGRIFVKKVKAE